MTENVNGSTNPVADAIAAVRKVGTIDELLAVNAALRARWNALQRRGASSFCVGDRVRFQTKAGREVVGTVERINRKTVGVSPDNPAERGWRVTPSILQPLKGER
ncbi:MAG: hypothetical protein LC798_13695 [Chloroflexi bacterium]|nr:hypothetical protein [Chloroflexota bacterium]